VPPNRGRWPPRRAPNPGLGRVRVARSLASDWLLLLALLWPNPNLSRTTAGHTPLSKKIPVRAPWRQTTTTTSPEAGWGTGLCHRLCCQCGAGAVAPVCVGLKASRPLNQRSSLVTTHSQRRKKRRGVAQACSPPPAPAPPHTAHTHPPKRRWVPWSFSY
jgi:hypothetical protein